MFFVYNLIKGDSMGWWSASILGGDEPLDYLGDLADICGVGSREEDTNKTLTPQEEQLASTLYSYEFTAEIVNNSDTRIAMLKYCDKAYDKNIAYQVLGVILMATGGTISDSLKKKIIKSAENDEWAGSKDEERISYIQSFIAAVTNYTDGVPVYTTTEGLFQKINEHLASGKSGLVNKNT